MFRYTLQSFDLTFQPFIFYWKIKKTKITHINNSLYIYTSQQKPLWITYNRFVDLTSVRTNTFLQKNISYVLYSIPTNTVISCYVYGIVKFQSRSLTHPIWEWYEREVLEKSKLFFTNLYDTRKLIHSYTLNIIKKGNLKLLKFPWLYTNNYVKNVKLTDSFKIIL